MKTVGVLGYHKDAEYMQNYRRAVEACGVNVVVLDEQTKDEAEEIGGLVITGGVDLNPALYHEQNICSINVDDALDRFELELLGKICQRQIPVLGICRGQQLINVYFGGSLYQEVEHPELHTRNGTVDRVHTAVCLKDSFLYQIYGKERLQVNSAHHQAVKQLGEGLRVVQQSEDGVIEAICHRELPVYSVQWHPERMSLKNRRPDAENGMELFYYFTKLCR